MPENPTELVSQKPSPRLVAIAVFLILAGTFFRFYNLENKVFWFDETQTMVRLSGHTGAQLRAELPELQQRKGFLEVRDLWKFQHLDQSKNALAILQTQAKDDAKHPPLYYFALYNWARWLGDSPSILRALSALISLLAMPAIFWLSRELFRQTEYSASIAWLSAALVAVSPLHVIYAQEARQYSLWTVLICVSCACLLRALRVTEKRKKFVWWSAYSLSVAAGMYTHPLFLLGVVAHAVYVLFLPDIAPEQPQKRRAEIALFCLAVAAAIVAFLPWGILILQDMERVGNSTAWMQSNVGLVRLASKWAFNFSAILADGGLSANNFSGFDFGTLFSLALGGAALVLEFCALLALLKSKERAPRLFLLTLIFIPFLILAMPDVVRGGIRSGDGMRYLVSCWIGVQLAVARWLAGGWSTPRVARRFAIIAILVFAAGFFSCAVNAGRDTRWNKSISFHVPRLARDIARAPRPLLIFGTYGNLMAFSHRLPPETGILLTAPHQPIAIPAGFETVFFYQPSRAQRDQLARENYALTLLDKRDGLWKVAREASS